MAIDSINSSTKTTERGTAIIRPGNEMDKNAFLRILVAELANQDPMNAKDSTQFVAQMAQFTSLEQMSNLNTTMSMNAANSMLGKYVTLNVSDDMGEPYYGVVKTVSKQGSQINVGVDVGTGELKMFELSDVAEVVDDSLISYL